MIDELKQWEFDKGYEKGKADAIEEFMRLTLNELRNEEDSNSAKWTLLGIKSVLEDVAEQLKESKK